MQESFFGKQSDALHREPGTKRKTRRSRADWFRKNTENRVSATKESRAEGFRNRVQVPEDEQVRSGLTSPGQKSVYMNVSGDPLTTLRGQCHAPPPCIRSKRSVHVCQNVREERREERE